MVRFEVACQFCNEGFDIKPHNDIELKYCPHCGEEVEEIEELSNEED